MTQIETLLQKLVGTRGSDLHLSANSPPRIRVNGVLKPIQAELLDEHATQQLVYSILQHDQIARFEREHELDFSFGIQGLGRFRTNVFRQRGTVGAVLRAIPEKVPPLEALGLPVALCRSLCELPKGLVLVTGPTGCGKSTTLAAMLDYINNHREEHVVTVEDPIEFIHANRACLFNQREVGLDTDTFGRALREILRQDPDVVLIGEMRDAETIQAALNISETGHLTFATLHTSDTVETVNRIIDVFPAHQQNQVRAQLSATLQAVFCQQLLPRKDAPGRILCTEVLVANSAIRALIREGKPHQIYSAIQTGGQAGMRTMNQSLAELVRTGRVDLSNALQFCTDPQDLGRQLSGSPRAGGTERRRAGRRSGDRAR